MVKRVLLLSMIGVCFYAPLAHAQVGEEDPKRATKLYEEGVEHYENKRYEEALEAFEQASIAYEDAMLFFNAASAAEKLGRDELAMEYVVMALEMKRRPLSIEMRASAERLKQHLELKMARSREQQQVALCKRDPEQCGQQPRQGKGTSSERMDTLVTPHLYASIAGGTGTLLLSDSVVVTANPDRQPPATALIPIHWNFSLGWQFDEVHRIGFEFRRQAIPYQDFSVVQEENKRGARAECLGLGIRGECMLGAMYQLTFMEGAGGKLRLHSGGGVGIGRTRGLVQIREPAQLSNGVENPSCVGKDTFVEGNSRVCHLRDTVRPGWAYLSGDVGASYRLGKRVRGTADFDLRFLGLDQTAVSMELRVGLEVALTR